jgi:hypothetical protein
VRAERLIFQRGDALYVTSADGKDAPRRLFAIGRANDTLWAASPDGRRVAWITRSAAANQRGAAEVPLGLAARPAVAFVSDLSGRHQKRLFDTADLRDRQGKRVASLDIDAATSSGSGPESTGKFEEWEPVSLAWSADGRTLYLSCVALGTAGGKATFGTDAASGYALVDAEERWRSLAAATYLDARGGVLAGSGLARFTVSSEPDTPQRYSPVVVVNLAEGTRTPLYSATGTTRDLPDYAFVTACALSPDTRSVAFVASNRGLWLVDRRTRAYRRLVDGAAQHPRWSEDGKRLLFLLPRTADSMAPVVNDLYEITPGTDSATTATPETRLLLQNVTAFDVTPD